MYGEPRLENLHIMWAKFRGSKIILDPPWCVVADFNEALSGFEHFFGNPPLRSSDGRFLWHSGNV